MKRNAIERKVEILRLCMKPQKPTNVIKKLGMQHTACIRDTFPQLRDLGLLEIREQVGNAKTYGNDRKRLSSNPKTVRHIELLTTEKGREILKRWRFYLEALGEDELERATCNAKII